MNIENIIGNLNILNSCVKNKVKKIFFASSLYSFSDQGSFYKCSKQSSEIYLMEFKKLYNLDYVILRYGSVYGEDCSVNNGVYKILKNLITKKKLSYSGSKRTERSYIHVRDVVNAFIHSLNNLNKMKSEIYNVGLSDANLSKLELCQEIKKHLVNFTFVEEKLKKDPDQRNYIVSNEKIEGTGFKTKYSLSDGIFELIKGYSMIKNQNFGNF